VTARLGLPRTPAGRRWLLGLAGAAVLLLILILLGGTRRPSPHAVLMDSAPPLSPEAARAADSGRVDAQFRNVRYYVDEDIVLVVSGLRGGLLPTRKDSMPVFDDPSSFAIDIADAVIAIDTASLGRLLTRYVFAYEGSPLRGLHVSIRDGELEQSGRLHKLVSIPFRIRASASVTPQGEIRIHPNDVKVLGLSAEGLMKLFSLELDDLIKSNRNHGVRIDGNDIVLDPSGMLPPPRIRGRLTALRLEPSRIVQVFGRSDSAIVPARQYEAQSLPNYMYFRHAMVRFGKLTMLDTDMLIADADTTSAFEFSLDRYHEQLVAGFHQTTAADGLVVFMPDLSALGTNRVPRPVPR
jgi:hypothetical protein